LANRAVDDGTVTGLSFLRPGHEVGPMTGRGRFEAPLFRIDPGKLHLQRLDPVT
jgi:hypothetical protein